MWLNRLLARRPDLTTTVRRRPVPQRSLRLSVERLEDRSVPSNFTATNVSDLIADMTAANAAGGSNTITLGAGKTFTLTAVDNTLDGATGLPVIAAGDSLTIVGNGDAITRSSATGTPTFRLFDVAVGASLTLRDVTLEGGLAFGSGLAAQGGAIFSQGTLDLIGTTVKGNTAQGAAGEGIGGDGDAARGGGIYSVGNLTLEAHSKVRDNTAVGGGGSGGGGDRGDFYGGGDGGDGLGGGVFVAGGSAFLSHAVLSNNTVQGGTGGPGGGPLLGGDGGTGGNGVGGGLYVAGGSVVVTDAKLSSNLAKGGQGGDANRQGRFDGGDGGDGLGGAVYAAGGSVTLGTDTITGNTAKAAKGGNGAVGEVKGNPGQGVGGGLFIDPASLVFLDAFTQSNVQQNKASTSDPDIHGPWEAY